MKKIFEWFKGLWKGISKNTRWVVFGLTGFFVGIIAIIYSIFLKGEDDELNKKIKKAEKDNNNIINRSRKFLRDRKKFKRKKL